LLDTINQGRKLTYGQSRITRQAASISLFPGAYANINPAGLFPSPGHQSSNPQD
jgi:hypothetical protein